MLQHRQMKTVEQRQEKRWKNLLQEVYPSKPQEHMHQANTSSVSAPSFQPPSQSGDLGKMRVMGTSSKAKRKQQISCCSSTEKVAQVADICYGERFPQHAD